MTSEKPRRTIMRCPECGGVCQVDQYADGGLTYECRDCGFYDVDSGDESPKERKEDHDSLSLV